MASHCNLRLIRAWTPRIALIIILMLLLLFFAGAGYILTNFLESGSYFNVDVSNNVGTEGANLEREKKIRELIDQRSMEREKIKNIPQDENLNKKDPFNLP